MLTTKFENGIYCIALERAQTRNALTSEFRAQITQALLDCPKAARVVQLRGTKEGFCSGQDLSEFQAGLDVKAVMEEEYQPIIKAIDALDVPIITAVQGACAGAGVPLALACDLVVASHSAFFQIAFRRVGLVPDILATYYLPRLVGRARAMGLALTGERLEAPRAKDWGLIWDVFDDDAFEDKLAELSKDFAEGPSLALGMTRKLMRVGADQSAMDQFTMEADAQARAAASHDFQEGVRAFLEKRAPRFKGQ